MGKRTHTKPAQRFLLRYLLPFVVVMLAFCLATDWIMRHYVIFRTPMHGAAKIHRSITRLSPELSILGSSRALGSYLPDTLSLRSYNYGINGTGYEVVDLFLTFEEQRPYSRTPIIINFDYDLWKPDLGDLNNYLPHVSHPAVRDLLKSQDMYSPWYELPAVRFFNSYDSYVKDYINFRVELTKLTSLGASLEKNKLDEATFARLVKKRLGTKAKWSPNEGQMQRLYAHFEKRPDRMFYLVVAPYHRSFYETFEGMEQAQAWLDEVDRRPNVDVVQVDGRNYPDSLFVNTTHINLLGAKRFSKEVRLAIFGDQKGESPTPVKWPPGYGPPNQNPSDRP